VESSWWRAYQSAWARSDIIKKWRKIAIPPEVIGGTGGQSAEEGAATLFYALTELGFAGTLDYSACYDLMATQVTVPVVTRLGWKPELCNILEDVWQNMERWVTWDQHTSPERLHAGHAAAQGDPWGPLSLNLWMAAGTHAVAKKRKRELEEEEKEVQRQLARPGGNTARKRRRAEVARKKNKVETAVYMDDRSWATSTATQVVKEATRWQNWSAAVQLRENFAKTQLACIWPPGTKQHESLVEAATQVDMQEYIKPTIEVLGAVSCPPRGRLLAAKENARLEAAKTALSWVACLPVGAYKRTQYARTFGLTKATYGWVARAPTAQATKKITAAVRKAAGRAMGGSQAFKDVLEGGTLNLDAVTGTVAVVMMWGTLRRGGKKVATSRWSSRRGTLCARVRHWLRRTGWEEDGPWCWKHAVLRETLKLTTEERGAVAHKARDGWRHMRWLAFLGSARRDAKALNQNQTSYDADCVRRARRNMLECPAVYSVAAGNFKSPQYWQCAAPGRYDDTCPFCGKQEKVSHEHIFWQCPRNGGIQPPADPLQRRLGWPCTGNKAYDGKVWNHMAQTVLSVWESRFPRSSPTWLRGNYCQ